MARRPGMSVVQDRVAAVTDGAQRLASQRVMVGVPAEKNSRNGRFGNASIAYVMENGDAAGRIPARPHLRPGVQRVQRENEETLKRALELALDSNPDGAERQQLHIVGLRAVNSIRAVIRGKIPPPLSPATIRGRINRAKSPGRRRKLREQLEYSPSMAWSMFTPLINTGAYIRSITYVLRRRGA